MNEIEQILSDFGFQIIGDIQAAMATGDVNATGKSSASLRFEANKDGFVLYGDKSFNWIEQGRAPGGMPPIDPIKDWIEARAIPYDDTGKDPLTSFAFAIARKIQRDGTYLHYKNKRRDVYSSIITEERVSALINLVHDRALAQVNSDIVASIK